MTSMTRKRRTNIWKTAKTTTFYMIVGMIRPSGGDIFLGSENVTKEPMYKRARMGIGYLSQDPSIFRGLSVEQNLLAILETIRMPKGERKDRLDSLLEELGISHIRKSMGYQLSGGERALTAAAILFALLKVKPSPFVILDEVDAPLDDSNIGRYTSLLREFAR